MMEIIPYGHQWLDEDDVDALVEVLRSDWLTTGPSVAAFEEALALKVGAKYAVAVSSGTAALHLSCLASNIGQGDTTVTTPITFAASANCALYVGAQPDFVDIDPTTLNISVVKLEKYLAACSESMLPKALIPVDFAGFPSDIEAISHLAKKYKFTVIEDACHALGASFIDNAGAIHKVGDCAYSDMTVFSFHPVKQITTGEGGAITTNSAEIYEKLRDLRNHGITRDRARLERDDGPWYYEMQSLGYNYRLTDIQCALGISQLKRLDAFIARRRFIARSYNEAFSTIPDIVTQSEVRGVSSSYHLYVIQLSGRLSGSKKRKKIFEQLLDYGIGAQVHYIPVHLHPYYQKNLGFKIGDFPDAESYYESAITLPLYPKMKDHEIKRVIDSVRKVISDNIG